MDDHTTLMMTLSMLVVVAERQVKIVKAIERLDGQVRANSRLIARQAV